MHRTMADPTLDQAHLPHSTEFDVRASMQCLRSAGCAAAGLTPVPGQYTFSEGELADILGFLETQHNQPPDPLAPTPDSLALLPGAGPAQEPVEMQP